MGVESRDGTTAHPYPQTEHCSKVTKASGSTRHTRKRSPSIRSLELLRGQKHIFLFTELLRHMPFSVLVQDTAGTIKIRAKWNGLESQMSPWMRVNAPLWPFVPSPMLSLRDHKLGRWWCEETNILTSWGNSAQNYIALLCRKCLFLSSPSLPSYRLAPSPAISPKAETTILWMTNLHIFYVIVKWSVRHTQPINGVQRCSAVCTPESTQES